jgi:hypothetical protein
MFVMYVAKFHVLLMQMLAVALILRFHYDYLSYELKVMM